MTDRITLALAACEGLTDEELAQRGPKGYRAMRDRKRKYAAAARSIAAAASKLAEENQSLKQQVAMLQSQLTTLQQLDAPVTDTSEAASIIASLAGKK